MPNDEPRIFRAASDGEVADEPWPEQRLFDAVARWRPEQGGGHRELIAAACTALAAGVDSPSLRELAGASVDDSYFDLRPLAERTLDELGVTRPGELRQVRVLPARDEIEPHRGTDSLRLEVVEVDESVGGFELQVFVNGVEMTEIAAGMSMDPNDVLVPTNKLIATPTPHEAPIARCGCGVYGCGTTDGVIVRDGDLVHWDWKHEVPMDRSVTFHAADYDAEMARLTSAYSWETPERTAGRTSTTTRRNFGRR